MTDRTFDTATGPDRHGQWGTIKDQPITHGTIASLGDEAEAGFPDATLNSVGRTRTVDTKRAETVTDRLDAVRRRVHNEHTSVSAVMRRALDEYLAS